MSYTQGVPRSGAEARRRLQQAALELYQERGFDQTTTAEIAARAGVNERTFFRHFPDKREVLFDGEADLRAALMHEVAEAPEGLAPLDVLLHAFRIAGRILEENRPFSEPRLAIIAVTPALRERDLAKPPRSPKPWPKPCVGAASTTGWPTWPLKPAGPPSTTQRKPGSTTHHRTWPPTSPRPSTTCAI